MSISNIKRDRAIRKSHVGAYPGSVEAMLGRIPDSVASYLPSAALAQMLDAMWDACQEAKGIAAADAISEGCV